MVTSCSKKGVNKSFKSERKGGRGDFNVILVVIWDKAKGERGVTQKGISVVVYVYEFA